MRFSYQFLRSGATHGSRVRSGRIPGRELCNRTRLEVSEGTTCPWLRRAVDGCHLRGNSGRRD